MSLFKKWKMLHLLHTKRGRSLSYSQLRDAGIDCFDDTVSPVFASGLVTSSGSGNSARYSLSAAAIEVLNSCIVARRNEAFTQLMMVDYPRAFVVMPFGEPWSRPVERAIKKAVKAAGLSYVRGDTPVRSASLMQTVATQIMQAGLVVADLSAPNVNVFYELGIAHALGKDAIVLKQHGKVLAADFQGAHYYEYSPAALGRLETQLTKALKTWVREHRCEKVKALSMAPGR